MPIPDGGIAHAEFMIGNTLVFISDEYPPYKAFAAPEGTTSSCLLCIEASDCDAAYDQAVAAGATSIQAPKDEFWGMRTCVLADPFGFRWSIGQVLEELSPEEVMKRARQAREDASIRFVEGRRFELRQGVWTDDSYVESMEIVAIESYSEAYFALLEERPELGKVLALGERVIVVIDRKAYRIGPS